MLKVKCKRATGQYRDGINGRARIQLPRSFLLGLMGGVLCKTLGAFAMESVHLQPEGMLSFPQPFQMGMVAHCQGPEFFCHPQTRFFFDFGYLRYPFFPFPEMNGVVIKLLSFELGNRYQPFENLGFFVSASLGYRWASLSRNANSSAAFAMDGVVLVSSAALHTKTFYLSPTVGWNLQLSERCHFEFELGVQLPLWYSGKMVLANEEKQQNSDNTDFLAIDSEQSMRRIAGLRVPRVTLLRLIWDLSP